MTSSRSCSLSPSLQVPESSNHPQVLILCYSKIPIMLHFSVPIALHWAPIPHPTPPTTHHPPSTSCSALWLSLLLSCLSSSSTVPSELCSMVFKFHHILNFLSEHGLYLPTLTKIPFFTKDSTSIANDNGCFFLHTLDTLRLMMLCPQCLC